MNDNQITDDLLEELEELENSASQLDKQVSDTQDKKKALEKLDSPSAIDATSLALEAAKTAQEAALQSQKAAEASLSHASRQKEQIMELSDANFSWRQAVKSSNKELKSAKNSFAIILGISLVTSVTAMSVMGWLLYSIQKKEANFKGEVLDILQTENALLTKQITIKVDELSALIELMTADIQKINKLGMSIQANTAGTGPVERVRTFDEAEKTQESTIKNDVILDLANEAKPIEHVKHPEVKETEKVHKEAKISGELHHETVQPTNSHKVSATDAHKDATPESIISVDQYSQLKLLIQNTLDEQHKLQAQTMAPATSHPTAVLSAQQEKQLKDISWLVRKQTKTLEEIKKTIGQAPTGSNTIKENVANRQTQQTYKAIQGSLIELKDQLEKLRAQQTQLQTQVNGIQKETKILSDAAKPYRYQLKQ